MRYLQIEAFDKDNNIIFKVRATRLDVSNILTIISTSVTNKESDNIRLLDCIDHWNIIDGMITIYYESGAVMEITRAND
jgi:hypothetical protein